MQNRAIILLFTLAVSFCCRAATCPSIDQIDITNPPAGWQLLLPPQVEDEEYAFGKAIHSQNIGFFMGQVICVYEACSGFGCPAFELLSEGVYKTPDHATPTWSTRGIIASTLTCTPSDHNPATCHFE